MLLNIQQRYKLICTIKNFIILLQKQIHKAMKNYTEEKSELEKDIDLTITENLIKQLEEIQSEIYRNL